MEEETFIIRSKFRDKHISKKVLEKEHENFKKEKPQLFNMICDETCDDNMLNKIMKHYKDVTNGSLS